MTQADYENPTGQLTRLNLPTTSTTIDYGYDETFRVNSIRTKASGTDRFHETYAYDNVGNITQIVDSTIEGGTQTQQFGYDALNRLTSACTLSGSSCSNGSSFGQYSETYSYDALGNLTNKGGTSMTYQGTQPHAVTHLDSSARNTYDKNGNMISRNDGSQTWTHTWTLENMLPAVTASSNSISLVY